MSSEDNKAIVRRIFEEVWNRGNLAVVDELVAPNFVFHDPSTTLHGPEGIKKYVMMYLKAYPDTHFTIEDQIAEGERVVTRWTVTATHKGELQGIPPTGKQVRVTGIVISHVAKGKVVEDWINWDALGMMQQLGVIPAPGQPG
jgi:steroid delta-isomerase-like uncharacterized protein